MDVFNEERGMLDLAFEFPKVGLDPTVFVIVYDDPLFCVHATPSLMSVCLFGTKLG